MTDPRTIRLVVGGLLALAMATVVGAILLSFANHEVPQIVVAIGSAAVGAVTGILTPGARAADSKEATSPSRPAARIDDVPVLAPR